jgi:hypothetical protein
VFRRGSPPEAAYIFKHALVQGTAHDSLLKSRRQQLHARIAEAIERHYPETASAQPQLLAQHYAEAGFAERSARAWLAAGHLSASRSASVEAALQFARGIDVLQGMEPGPERDRLELDLQIGRGSASSAVYGHGAVETESAWLRAIALLRADPDDPRNFWARRGLSAVYGSRPDMTAYAVIAEETMERAQYCRYRAALCVAHMLFCNLSNYTGNFAGSSQHLAQAARYYRADEDKGSVHLSGLDLGVHIAVNFVLIRSLRGAYAAAQRSINECLRRAEAQPQVWTVCFAGVWASLGCLIQRDFEQAGALAERAIALAREHALSFWATVNQLSQGAALVIVDPGRAVGLMGDALTRLEQMRAMSWHHHYLCFEAEALLRLDRIADARAMLNRAFGMIERTGMSWWVPELHRIRAAVIRAEGGDDAAVREELARAVTVAGEHGSETFRRRAAAELGAMSVLAGRTPAA